MNSEQNLSITPRYIMCNSILKFLLIITLKVKIEIGFNRLLIVLYSGTPTPNLSDSQST